MHRTRWWITTFYMAMQFSRFRWIQAQWLHAQIQFLTTWWMWSCIYIFILYNDYIWDIYFIRMWSWEMFIIWIFNVGKIDSKCATRKRPKRKINLKKKSWKILDASVDGRMCNMRAMILHCERNRLITRLQLWPTTQK